MSVQNVLTYWYLHQCFLLFEVLEAQTALSLLRHVAKFVTTIGLFDCHGTELNFFHYFEIDTDHGFTFWVNAVLFIKLSIAIETTITSDTRSASLLVLSKEKTDDFDKNDN